MEEYEKVLEEKRKALVALKTEARKVDGKEFASMQQLTDKKANDEVFIKLVNHLTSYLMNMCISVLCYFFLLLQYITYIYSFFPFFL